jgi:hypothetical protein
MKIKRGVKWKHNKEREEKDLTVHTLLGSDSSLNFARTFTTLSLQKEGSSSNALIKAYQSLSTFYITSYLASPNYTAQLKTATL